MLHQAITGVRCCQLPEWFRSLCAKDSCFFLTQGCRGLWGDHALTCASLLSCNKVKNVGCLQVVRNKASSSRYWSLIRRRQVSVCRMEKPQVLPSLHRWHFQCFHWCYQQGHRIAGSAALSQRNKSYHGAMKLNIHFPFLIKGQKLGSPSSFQNAQSWGRLCWCVLMACTGWAMQRAALQHLQRITQLIRCFPCCFKEQ